MRHALQVSSPEQVATFASPNLSAYGCPPWTAAALISAVEFCRFPDDESTRSASAPGIAAVSFRPSSSTQVLASIRHFICTHSHCARSCLGRIVWPREPIFRSTGRSLRTRMSAGLRSYQQDWSSQRLRVLAEHLCHYSTPPLPLNGDTSDSSRIGMSASAESSKDLNLISRKKRAAVLVCLYTGADGEVRVILTKRSGSLTSHAGDVALPGGKQDEGDADDIATALREAHEEIGLLSSQVRVVTVLEPFFSRTLMIVIPVIGFLEDVKQFIPVPNTGEVDAIFNAPLEMFLGTENYSFKEREWLGVKYRVHSFEYAEKDGEKFVIYGLTASVLVRTAAIIFQREPNFLECPPFLRAWSHLPEALNAMQ